MGEVTNVSVTHCGVVHKTQRVVEESDGYYIVMDDETNKLEAIAKDEIVRVESVVVAHSIVR